MMNDLGKALLISSIHYSDRSDVTPDCTVCKPVSVFTWHMSNRLDNNNGNIGVKVYFTGR